ncbi:MAG: hypothetical protein ACLSG4_06700 [Anaerobutyricum sp.]
MLKNLTISGKVNFITEIIAVITWAILLIAAKDDWQFFAVFSIPLLILIPICGWFLMPVSKKISEKGKTKSGWWKVAWYTGMFVVNLFAAFILMMFLCAGVGALIGKVASGGLADIGTSLVLAFMMWMAAFGIFFLAMLPQIQIIILKILESRQSED